MRQRLLAGVLANAKQWAKAKAVIYTIQEDSEKRVALCQLAKIKQWERDGSVADRIEENDKKEEALSEFSEALINTQQRTRAELAIHKIQESKLQA